jgi:iron(III) transport system ATP-binding protein
MTAIVPASRKAPPARFAPSRPAARLHVAPPPDAAAPGEANSRTDASVTAAPQPALIVSEIRQTYGKVRAVDDVSLELAPGEIIALLGHSGSGKSTLLRLIAGLDRPQSGTVVIDGIDVTDPFVPPERRGVGMMFQDYALFPHLTVLGNLTFGLKGMPRGEANAVARATLSKIGLAAREAEHPHRLSGGEQQRIALARALLPRPKILLMDEPFSNLDRRTRDLIRDQTAQALRDSGTTAILVTHDPDDAMRMADRILLMHAGRIDQSGTAEELYHRPASLLAARFFSDFNEIAGVVSQGTVATPVGSFPAPGLPEGAAATVCIRHGDIALDLSAQQWEPRGAVVSTAFTGEHQLVVVAIEGAATTLTAEAPAGTALRPGQQVGIAVAPPDAFVFRAESPSEEPDRPRQGRQVIPPAAE